MTNRYEVIKKQNRIACLRYTYGRYMKVECNPSSGRTIIVNEIGDRWIEYQFDEIFGLGEYKKLCKHLVTHNKERNTNNPNSIKHTIVADYLPRQAKKDIKYESEDNGKEDLIDKFFKKKT